MPSFISLYRYSDYQFALYIDKGYESSYFYEFIHELVLFIEEQTIQTDMLDISLTAFAGFADSSGANDLLTCAKMALKNSILKQKKISLFDFENTIYSQLVKTLHWRQVLVNAIQNDDIAIFGQPIVDNKTDVISTEVLMRYFDASKSEFSSPMEFLPYAKQSQVYCKLSQKVLKKAFAYFSIIKQEFSVNLTKTDIENADTIKLIKQLITHYDMAHLVTFELLECLDFDVESQSTHRFINEMKLLGCKIAIDDFGSGYSNFEYLAKMPIDIVKIDGSLVKDVLTNPKHYSLVQTIVSFCDKLGIKTVVEHVEDEQSFKLLKEAGVSYFQGYHFYRPTHLLDNTN